MASAGEVGRTLAARRSLEGLDLERIAEVIRASQADVVALQEVDRRVPRSGNVDQAETLARLTGMEVIFGKNIDLQGGGYGNAILSRYPIVRSQNHALPRINEGEQRGVLEAEIALGRSLPSLTLLATHLDHRPAEQERLASARQLNALVAKIETPLAILAGDLNARPTSATLQRLFERWRPSSLATLPTIPVAQPTRQIDFVLFRPEDRLIPVETRVLDEPVASDHRPVLAHFTLAPEPLSATAPLERILFGSCIKQDQPMPILETMAAEEADLLLLLGDNIYADTADMEVMRAKYDRLAANRRFAQLRGALPMLATWDDHDYGQNDAGQNYPQRDEAAAILLDFWQEPLQSPRRRRPGIYTAATFGPPGKRVQIILLDTRYFRSPLKRGERRTGGPYLPDPDPEKTMLGATQWQWLRQQLQAPAELRIIASSIQCLASAAGQETWSNLPRERERLFQTIRDSDAEGVLLISGDRHWAELSEEPTAVGYPLYDLTSSSLNQPHPRGTPTDNRHRAMDRTFHRENYGAIDIDWNAPSPQLRLRIIDQQGTAQLQKQLSLSQLRRSETPANE